MQRSLVVLTAHPELHTPRRLLQAGRALAIDVELRVPAGRGAPLANSLAVGALLLARPGTFSLLTILKEHRRLVTAGAAPLQSRRSLIDACDKWRALRRAAAAGLPIPISRLVRAPMELPRALAVIPGDAWFVKGRRGSQGTHVILAATRDDALRAGHLFWGTGAACLAQEDLRARGRVERHLLVRGEFVASAIARPAPGEFRSNAHRGGRFEMLAPGEGFGAALARRAVAAIGLPYAGVDTIGEERPALLEVNASPGIETLERVTGRDLAVEILARLLAA